MSEPTPSTDEAVRLELDAPVVALSVLVSATGILANLVHEVSKVFRGGESVEWTVELEQGSIVLPIRPQVPADVRAQLVAAVVDGLTTVEERAERPPYFNDRALTQARALANLSTADLPIRVRTPSSSLRLTQSLVAHVDQVTGQAPPRIGTVEGRLDVVSVHGRPIFAVWERLTDDRVECFAGPEITVDDLRNALGKRVAVRGRIRSVKGGQKQRIDATELRVFADEEDLPTADEVRGILRAS